MGVPPNGCFVMENAKMTWMITESTPMTLDTSIVRLSEDKSLTESSDP